MTLSVACVDLAELPLQILLRRRPDWARGPAVVVDEDKPQGVVQWANEPARALRVLPGMRYAAALSLAPDLRAGEISEAEVRATVEAVVQLLLRHTPHVEPAEGEPGVFWLDATGLAPLYATPRGWADAVGETLWVAGFRASMAVGHTRFGTYALARGRPGLTLLADLAAEREACDGVRLDRLRIEARLRDRLAKLGVHTVGALRALPAGGIQRRFGAEAHALHRRATRLYEGEGADVLRPHRPDEPLRWRLELEWAEARIHPLLFQIKSLFDQALGELAARRAAVAGFELVLGLDHTAPDERTLRHPLRPARPTLDAALLLDLARLRLEGAEALPAGVVELELSVEPVPAEEEQLRLFALSRDGRPARDLDKGARALARVRAELGDGAVGCLALREGHLPEARFAFVPWPGPLLRARPGPLQRVLVRRLYPRPLPLPAPRRLNREDGWQPRRSEQGPIVRLVGPYVVSGGWWGRRGEQHREYCFALTRRGDLLWVYYDRARRRWFECGRVE